MAIGSSRNEMVDAIGRMNITGNVVPLQWFKHLRLENGKTDSIAALLLAEIVYWYRPIEQRDETTGKVLCWRKKFAADKLQKSYGALADQFGFTKRQVTAAMHRLETAGLITLELRTLTVGDGLRMGNVLFVGVNADAIERITFDAETSTLSRSSVIAPTPKCETNTETTTEIITDDRVLSSVAPEGADATGKNESVSPVVETPKPKRERKPRTPTEWERQRHELGETFTNETNLSSEGMTFAERERRWWSPLKTILAAAKGDMTFAKQLIVLAVEQGRKSRLTLASPQSIEQIAIALSATTKPRGDGAAGTIHQQDQHWEAW